MISKIKYVWALFHKGQEVTNPELYKDVHNAAMVLTALLLMIFNGIKMFTHYDIPLDQSTANEVGLGLASAISWVLHNITSKRAGLPSEVLPTPQPDGLESPLIQGGQGRDYNSSGGN